MLAGKFPWSKTGGHHLAQCDWQGKTVTAIDGRQNDFLANRALGLMFR